MKSVVVIQSEQTIEKIAGCAGENFHFVNPVQNIPPPRLTLTRIVYQNKAKNNINLIDKWMSLSVQALATRFYQNELQYEQTDGHDRHSGY